MGFIAPPSVWRRRGFRFLTHNLRKVASFGIGLLVGAYLAGTALFLLFALLSTPTVSADAALWVTVALLVPLVGVQLLDSSSKLPSARRQVPQTTVDGGSKFGMLRFGLEMGSGVRTYMTSTAPYMVLVALAIRAPGYSWYALGATMFAAGRLLPLVVKLVDSSPSGLLISVLTTKRYSALVLSSPCAGATLVIANSVGG